MSKGMSVGKGGARHFAKPFLDPGILFRILDDHHDLVQSFGANDIILKNQAIDRHGLVNMLPLLRALAKVEPTMEVHTGAMRQALNSLLVDNPAINNTKFNGSVWVSLRQEKLTTLLAHFRRLKSDGEMRKCAQKLTAAEFLQLQEVVDKTTEKPSHEESTFLGKRKLKKDVSDATLDEDGFPRCFSSPITKVPLPTKTKKQKPKKRRKVKNAQKTPCQKEASP